MTNRPGISFHELKLETGMGNGVLAHHLRALERTGRIETFRTGRTRRHYVRSGTCSHSNRAHAVATSAPYAYTLQVITGQPGLSLGDYVPLHAGLHRHTVARRLTQLRRANLVVATRERNRLRYWPVAGAAGTHRDVRGPGP